MIARLIREIANPIGGDLASEHHRATTFAGHVLLGAMAQTGGLWWAGFVVAGLYWLAKERGDLRRGGAWRDGLEDTVGVWFGTYYGPWWWPFMASAGMAVVFVLAAWRRG